MKVLVFLCAILTSSFVLAASFQISESSPLKLLALCESFDGNSYLGVWVRGDVYTVDYTDDLDLGDTSATVTNEQISIETLLTWEPIVIPSGKNVVDIAGSPYNCDY